MTYLCELDPVEDYEPLPCDELNERTMQQASLRLLRAVERAQGKYVAPEPKVAYVSPVSKITHIPGEIIGARIIRMTAEAYGYSLDELKGDGRHKRIVCARAVAARLLRNVRWENGRQRFSYPQIAKMLNRGDHSTICYALDMFGPYRRKYPEMKAIYNLLRRRLA